MPRPNSSAQPTPEAQPPTAVPATPTFTPPPPRLLTICMAKEPESLFVYRDSSVAARSVRQAIYDGPIDTVGFQNSPVILERMPDLANGDFAIGAVMVNLGDQIVDSRGNLVNLAEGVSYSPPGCGEAACAQVYSGAEPVQMDQWAVRFKLRSGLQWSDGAPLTADDSLYSYEVASGLYPAARPDLISHTAAYQALDETTVEWRGLPGYRESGYADNFFIPLPRHAWAELSPQELLQAEPANRTPLGWGAYVIDEWTAGDHISLRKNPAYFRSAEGLPAFDRLVFRFIPDPNEALAALQAGECDYLDESIALESQAPQLLELQAAGKIAMAAVVGAAWEHVDFAIQSLNPAQPALFQLKETRQALALCIDRQRLADELFSGQSRVPDSYIHPDHPLANPQARRYAYDPQAGGNLLTSAGWSDADGDPATPRLAQGVAGVTDGTPLAFAFLTTVEDEKQRAAQIIKENLAQCGVQIEITSLPWQDLYAPGPSGPLFGRNFALAQFGWISAAQPPCYLYTTDEIPGPYPGSPKGWGGANASGYSSPAFDLACQQALTQPPDLPAYAAAQAQAQAIFAEDLPAIPLYLRPKLVAMRPDLCNVLVDPSVDSALWNVELFNEGDGCAP